MTDDARYGADTIADLYRVIWRITGRQQLLLIALAVIVAALAAAPLKFQQLVINSLVYGGDIYLVAWLCAGLLGVTLLSAALKFALNFRLSVLGEQIVLRLRERLYANYVVDATTGAPDTPKRGTLVTMLAAEAESVGSFAGSAIASPLVQLGTLLSVIAFILASEPWLGVLALGVVLPQAAIVVALQSRIISACASACRRCATPRTGSQRSTWRAWRKRSSQTFITCSRRGAGSSSSSSPRNSL